MKELLTDLNIIQSKFEINVITLLKNILPVKKKAKISKRSDNFRTQVVRLVCKLPLILAQVNNIVRVADFKSSNAKNYNM